MTVLSLLDAAGRRRSPATLPGYHAGRPPRNKGMRYPADPPTVEEIVAVMRHAPDDRHGWRVRAMILVLRSPAAHPGSARARRARSPLPAQIGRPTRKRRGPAGDSPPYRAKRERRIGALRFFTSSAAAPASELGSYSPSPVSLRAAA